MSSSTRTVTQTQSRVRAYSISLIAAMPSKSALDTLPSEILLHILRYALPQPTHRQHGKVSMSALAIVNRTFYAACSALIYRSVVLHTPHALALFARTATSHPSLPAAHVRSLAFTYNGRMRPEIRLILGVAIRVCSNMHTLVLPGACLPGLILPPAAVSAPSPKHVTLSGWGDIQTIHAAPSPVRPVYPTELFRETTHLSIAGPPAVWARPRDILHALGDLPRMTHLCLARRTGGNSDNDEEFVNDIRELRAKGATKIVVSMVPNMFATTSSTDETSAFEHTMKEMGIAIREGNVEEWRSLWTNAELGSHMSGLEERYWITD